MLPIDEKVEHTQRYGRSDAPTETVRQFFKKAWRVKVKVVCEPCNTQWMSRIEDRAKLCAPDLILGSGGTLDEPAQRALATWAMLKVLMAECRIPASERVIPQEHYHDLFTLRDTFTLPPRMRVWVAAFGQSEIVPGFFDRRGLVVHGTDPLSGEPVRADSYAATFSVGELVLKVFGHTLADALELAHHEGFKGAVARIWPVYETFAFPPGPKLTRRGLEQFAFSFAPPS